MFKNSTYINTNKQRTYEEKVEFPILLAEILDLFYRENFIGTNILTHRYNPVLMDWSGGPGALGVLKR